METVRSGHELLKSSWRELEKLRREADDAPPQPRPSPEKPYAEGARLVDLVAPDKISVGNMPLREAIGRRRSRRQFTNETLTLEELSFLLWATQGVTEVVQLADGTITRRTVPSGGSIHAFETYLCVNRVEGVAPGLYRYLPLEHKLLFMRDEPGLAGEFSRACCGQDFVGTAAVIFAWTTVRQRMERRYKVAAHKIIAIDAGHLCQNLYLASEAINAGTCAIGAYYQEEMDAVLGVDGDDEFTVYAAPVGKIE